MFFFLPIEHYAGHPFAVSFADIRFLYQRSMTNGISNNTDELTRQAYFILLPLKGKNRICRH